MTIYTSWHLKPVHRNTDSRTCGATTLVSGQSTVFANNLLVSVNADPNSHSAGALVAGSNHVYAENTLVVNNSPDGSAADADVYATAVADAGAMADVRTEAANITTIGTKIWQNAGATSDPGGFYYVSVTFAADGGSAGDMSFIIEYVVN